MTTTTSRTRKLSMALALGGGGLCVAVFSQAAVMTPQARSQFLSAEHALARHDHATYEILEASLETDPLDPYLRFEELTRNLKGASSSAIEKFLDDYPGTQLAQRLRRAYLKRLADGRQWSDYVRVYRPTSSTRLQCLYLQALLETGHRRQAMNLTEPLWLSGHSQPSACNPVFQAWQEEGGMTTGLVWKRIRLAMAAGKTDLARYLGSYLPDSERVWLQRWLDVLDKPELVLQEKDFSRSHPMRATILAQGIARLAAHAPERAAEAVRRWRPVWKEDPQAADLAYAAAGRALVENGQNRGFNLWNRMRELPDNLSAQERRIRAAISRREWHWVAVWIARMPDSPEKTDRWIYWLARAQAALGLHETARVTYQKAAQARSFWGFLAADRIGAPYALHSRPTPADPQRIYQIVVDPTFRRIRELRDLGRSTDMRREWRTLTAHMPKDDLMAAAYVADVLRWYDQAILTLARTGYWDDLELRFPLAYSSMVDEAADQVGIDRSWIYAVIRQESVFSPGISSPAGAVGLMQLLPDTAIEMADRIGIAQPTARELTDPRINILLGSAYLKQMRERFGHIALATAAYNAGPYRVETWLPDKRVDADIWISEIPYPETRNYVERVLSYRLIYAYRLGQPRVSMNQWLAPILPASGYAAK